MSLLLFKHNQTAYDSAVNMLKKHKKAAIIHPTGTGKSFIGFKLCKDNPNKKICWLSPSEYIFKTQIENVCKVDSDFDSSNVVFITYTKLMNMSKDEMLEINPSYIILDEFHRAGAEKWGEGIEQLLNLYKQVPILGLSATNIRYLDNQRNMAEELFDGYIASEMSLGEAIVRGILNPPKYIVSVFSYQQELEKYNVKIKKIKNKQIKDKAQKQLEALRRTLEKADGLDEIFKKHMDKQNGKYIVFCANVEHMKEMIDKVPEWCSKIDLFPHVYLAYSDNPETSNAFADFKSDNSEHLKLLFCIDMLNEGIHVEDISGVILLRPTVSPIIYKQQIGRALSASKNNEAVIFDIVLNFENLYSICDIKEEMGEAIHFYRDIGEEEAIINEHFHIIDEIRDCREIFDELEKILTLSWDNMYILAKQYYERYGDLNVSRNNRQLYSWILRQRSNYRLHKITPEQYEKLSEIGMVWEFEDSWMLKFHEAKKYYEENGNLDIPADFVSKNGIGLGRWYRNVLTNYKDGVLSDERKKLLESIGINWISVKIRVWMKYYKAAQEYYKMYGNLNIKLDYATKNGLNLGVWISSQRYSYKKKRLNKEQIELLEKIGISWHRDENRWQMGFEHAKEYFEEYGNINPNYNYVCEDGFKLGAWINSQKIKYKNGKLKKAYIDLLESLNIIWFQLDAIWEIGFEQLREYYRMTGDCNVSCSYITDSGFKLGSWVANQRTKYKENKLSLERINRLQEIHFIWNIQEEKWNRAFEYAREFAIKHNAKSIPYAYITDDGFKLGEWYRSQKRIYKNGSYDNSRLIRLKEIGLSLESEDFHKNSLDKRSVLVI